MPFTSLSFLLFVAVTALIYFCFPKKHRWIILLVASYVFYWVSSNWVIIYMVATTLSTFYVGRWLGRAQASFNQARQTDPELSREAFQRKKKLIFVAALLFNFGILVVVKYGNFIVENFNAVFSMFGLGAIPMTSLLLPLGVSFYTFQSMGYLIDVYRGKYQPDESLPRFALFVSFFPQIVQGPIGRYDDLASQLYRANTPDYDRIKDGLLLMGCGFMKKQILGDRLGVLEDYIFNQSIQTCSGSIIALGALLSMFRLYCDFSGGIDIARGVARILGIDLARNFNHPYFSRSVAEFWRRWHMTLGGWMRDYLFYTLLLSKSMQRLSKIVREKYGLDQARIITTATATFVVFLVIGIWHGAEWKRVIYGLCYASVITFGIIFGVYYQRMTTALHINTNNFFYKLYTRVRTACVVAFIGYFSRSIDLTHALENIWLTFTDFAPARLFDGTLLEMGLDKTDFRILILGTLIFLVLSTMQEHGHNLGQILARRNICIRWAVYCVMFFAILLFSMVTEANVRGFIYANF